MKCILLVRVSTERQNFDEQERELYQMAINDGFQNDNILSISMVESATMKSEEERKGLNLMKEEIEKGNVACVYAWEVSRISRRRDVLFSILRYLYERKIQLKIKSPSITYLNDDGTINESADISFSLFATLAESEMRNKKARFKRSAKHNARVGKYSGGNVLFGYMVNEDGYYIVNEEEAELVRLIFHLYTTTNNGAKLIRNELSARGYKITPAKIMEILANPAYTGQPYITRKRNAGFGDIGGYQRVFPQIISQETYDIAKEKRASKHIVKTDSCLLAKGLIRCPCCGWVYTGIRAKTVRMYKCSQRNLADKYGRHCDNGITVQMEVTDSVLWYVASFQYSLFVADMKMKDTSKLEERIAILQRKIEVAQEVISAAGEKLEKIADMYLEGLYTKIKKEKAVDKVRQECSEKEKEIFSYQKETDDLKRMIEKVKSVDEYTAFSDATIDVSSIDDRRVMLGIVNQFIECLEVGEGEFQGRKSKTYKVNLKDGTSQNFLTIGRTTNAKFFEVIGENVYDITNKVTLLLPI